MRNCEVLCNCTKLVCVLYCKIARVATLAGDVHSRVSVLTGHHVIK